MDGYVDTIGNAKPKVVTLMLMVNEVIAIA
jgi:hypothetical protein